MYWLQFFLFRSRSVFQSNQFCFVDIWLKLIDIHSQAYPQEYKNLYVFYLEILRVQTKELSQVQVYNFYIEKSFLAFFCNPQNSASRSYIEINL